MIQLFHFLKVLISMMSIWDVAITKKKNKILRNPIKLLQWMIGANEWLHADGKNLIILHFLFWVDKIESWTGW